MKLVMAVTAASLALLAPLTAGTAASAAPASVGTAVHTARPAMLPDTTIKRALLTLPEITRFSGMKTPVTAKETLCHNMPYINGDVTYCYYDNLRSDKAYAAKQFSATHVDILSFDNTGEGKRYLGEMLAVGSKAAITLNKTPTMAIRFDPQYDIVLGQDADGKNITKPGPAVTYYKWIGLEFVYATCANPAGSTASLTTCASNLVKAQVAKLSKTTGKVYK